VKELKPDTVKRGKVGEIESEIEQWIKERQRRAEREHQQRNIKKTKTRERKVCFLENRGELGRRLNRRSQGAVLESLFQ